MKPQRREARQGAAKGISVLIASHRESMNKAAMSQVNDLAISLANFATWRFHCASII
jgi:hypothetical protein